MGSIKSGGSLKSWRSISMKSCETVKRKSSCLPKACFSLAFEECVQKALGQFECPVNVAILKEAQREVHLKKTLKPDSKYKQNLTVTRDFKTLENSAAEINDNIKVEEDPDVLSLITRYDSLDQLIEIEIIRYKCQPIPRVLMQVLALIAPHLHHLTAFTIKECLIDIYTVCELKRLLSLTCITDVCLDQSPLLEGNYDILLSELNSLRTLSLARCNINDDVCLRLAGKLSHSQPAQRTLFALNLSSNDITNKGAEYLAEALRTNRHLRYLNLADNHIDDDGATYILNVLKEFPLTRDEVREKHKRYLNYLKEKKNAYSRCMQQLLTQTESGVSVTKQRKSCSRKGKLSFRKDVVEGGAISVGTQLVSIEDLTKEASTMTEELVGPFEEPFDKLWTKMKNNEVIYNGNFILCYLNLAYNNLTNRITQLLLEVIIHQQKLRTDELCGLIKIVLDGNHISEGDAKLKMIGKLLKGFFEKKGAIGKRRTPVHRSWVL